MDGFIAMVFWLIDVDDVCLMDMNDSCLVSQCACVGRLEQPYMASSPWQLVNHCGLGMQLSWLEHRTIMPLMQVRFPSAARDFSSRVNIQYMLSSFTCVCTPLCAIACINVCAHIKDPVVQVRVQWIMETLKHPVCTVGRVVQLCCSWLSPGKATRISHGENPTGTMQL